jgi:dienelactone hydrolase
MSYRPAEAADAWERIFEFFGAYLRGEAAASA